MQNKPNFLKLKMSASVFFTKDYENETVLRLQENKPNQSRFQTNFGVWIAEVAYAPKLQRRSSTLAIFISSI